MKKNLFISILYILSLNIFAEYAHYSYFNGFQYYQALESEKLKELSDWQPEGEEACPLHYKKAVKLTRKFLEKRFPYVTDWEIKEIALTKDRRSDKWFYLLGYYGSIPEENKEGRGNRISVIITLDEWIPEMEKKEKIKDKKSFSDSKKNK